MCNLHPVVDAANDQAFFAPIKLEGFAKLKVQRNVGRDVGRLAFALAPGSNEVGDGRVPTAVARSLDLGMQRTRRASLVLGPARVGRQGLLQLCLIRTQLVGAWLAPVLGRLVHRRAQPLGYRVARQPRLTRYLPLRQLVPRVQPSDLANHVHGDHSLHPTA